MKYRVNFKRMPARLEPVGLRPDGVELIDTIDYRCPVCNTLHKDLDYTALARQAERNKDYMRLPCGHMAAKI